MLDKLLNPKLLELLPQVQLLSEVRIRLNKRVVYSIQGKYYTVEYLALKEDIERIIRIATKNSLYSYQDSISNGYISTNGYRIGIAGDGVIEKNNIITIKNINSLCIRIPHEITNNSHKIDEIIKNFDNTLIISKPGLGKTTLLRDIIKRISNNGFNVLVLDERGEISYDNSLLDLGENTDVINNIPKTNAYSTFIRVLRPDIIATDEIFGEYEVNAIEDVIRCGVKVIATLHSSSISNINQKIYAKLISYMRYIVVLKDVGIIDKVVDRGNV